MCYDLELKKLQHEPLRWENYRLGQDHGMRKVVRAESMCLRQVSYKAAEE